MVWAVLASARMEPLTIALLIIGGLALLVGGIMLLVAAFQQSVWWGIAYLLVPFAALVFVVMHWDSARRGFLLNLLGAGLVVGGVIASPSVRESVSKGLPAGMNLPMLEREKPSDLNEQILATRAQIEQWEAQFQQDGAALAQEFQALDAHRKALKAGDAAEVAAFNAEAAAYQPKNAALKQLRQQIDAAQKELAGLLDQRARQQAAAAKAPGADRRAVTIESAPTAARSAPVRRASGPVVIFTTSHCGWCTRAKQYFARKGVNYEERDIERSSSAHDEFKRLGGRGVPLIMVGTEKISGFDQARLDQLL